MSTPGQAALELLATALELEKKGKDFYDRAAAECANPLGRDIFKILAADELAHIERIKTIHASLEAGRGWSGQGLELKLEPEPLDRLFRQLAEKAGAGIAATASDLEALDTGIELETRSIQFYQDRAGQAQDRAEKTFLERLAQEERSHHRALADLKLYLADPAAWFREKEKGGLDGA